MYYDLLARIKNATHARKETLLAPFSNFDFAVAGALVKARYIVSVEKKTLGKKNFIEIKLKYRNDEPAVTDFKLMSKPSRRLYTGYRDLRSIRQNFGITVLSTPLGVMSNHDARKVKVGGEPLFQIW